MSVETFNDIFMKKDIHNAFILSNYHDKRVYKRIKLIVSLNYTKKLTSV